MRAAGRTGGGPEQRQPRDVTEARATFLPTARLFRSCRLGSPATATRRRAQLADWQGNRDEHTAHLPSTLTCALRTTLAIWARCSISAWTPTSEAGSGRGARWWVVRIMGLAGSSTTGGMLGHEEMLAGVKPWFRVVAWGSSDNSPGDSDWFPHTQLRRPPRSDSTGEASASPLTRRESSVLV